MEEERGRSGREGEREESRRMEEERGRSGREGERGRRVE